MEGNVPFCEATTSERKFDLADPVGLGGDSQSLSTNRICHEGHTSHCGLTQTQKLSYSIMLKIAENYGQLMGEMMFETESWGTPISDTLHIISLVESISLLGGSSLSCSLVKSQYIDWVDIIPYSIVNHQPSFISYIH